MHGRPVELAARGTGELKMRAFCTSLRATLVAGALACVLAGCQTELATFPVAVDPETASEANIESLSAVIARDPSNAESYNVRGSAYGRAGRYREALADFDAAIQLNPRFSRAYANRALVHMRNGDVTDAAADFNRAIAADPNYAAAYVG